MTTQDRPVKKCSIPPPLEINTQTSNANQHNLPNSNIFDYSQVMEHPHIIHIRRLLLDALMMILIAALAAAVKYGLDPYERGYYCDDESIRLSYHPSTVPATVAYVAGGTIVLMLIIITEYHNTYVIYRYRNNTYRFREKINININGVFIRYYKYFAYYLFGCAVNALFTDSCKMLVGRLRPNFYSVCEPDIQDCLLNPTGYITNFTCAGGDAHLLREMRLSFPSGHSSFVFYTAVFAAFYVQARAHWAPYGARLLQTVVQIICLLLALCVALSRISDHKHHWSDVLAGSLLGAGIAVAVTVYFGNFFHAHHAIPTANGLTQQLHPAERQMNEDVESQLEMHKRSNMN